MIVWVALLPLVVGLWIWESDWSLWLRPRLLFIIAVGNLGALGPKPRREDSHATGAESGRIQAARQEDDRDMPALRPSREEQND